jgi:hypothetical protein
VTDKENPRMTAVPSAVVRVWARANGYTVSDRGRIPLDVQAAFDTAHAAAEQPVPPVAAQPPPWPAQPGAQQWPPQQQPWPSQAGAPQWGPPGPPPIDQGVDGFAIAALVLGILPACGGILGIIFGIVSLNRIAGTAKRGRKMAIAGIVCGSLWVVLIVVGIIASIALGPDRDHTGAVTSSGDVDATDLQIGDCAQNAPAGETTTVHVVPCSQPHGAEVFAEFTLEGDGYPGSDQVDRFALGGCRSRVAAYVGPDPAQDYDLYYLVPTTDTWAQGDRSVTCLLGGPNGAKVTGTVRVA